MHPFEFFSGEMLHLLCVWLVPSHVVAVVVFVAVGGVLASLNHTRFDVAVPGLYEVRSHDMHHKLPKVSGPTPLKARSALGDSRRTTRPRPTTASTPCSWTC